IYKKDEPCEDTIFLVLDGEVNFETDSEQTSYKKSYKKSDYFGLESLFSKKFVNTAKSNLNSTKVLIISKSSFQKLLKVDNHFLAKLVDISLNYLESISADIIKAPEKPLSIVDVFGQGADRISESVKKENMKIIDHINLANIRTLSPNSLLFSENDKKDNSIYLILQGEIEQSKLVGKEEKHVITIGPGALFGFLKKPNNQGHVLTARATIVTTKVVNLNHEVLVKVSEISPHLAFCIFLNVIITIAIVESAMIKR
ncbi:MAG: cyclic nucleotide-binding domain-containing protein, partial [Leptospiraceae bacterium]|nr:cyclic nucleotide-binding domain-containing protein [Leptospiraceae bacterium]